MKFRVSALIALLTIGSTASAQVGYPPARSPYLDLTYSQELTAIFGYYVGREDPAGVAPGMAPSRVCITSGVRVGRRISQGRSRALGRVAPFSIQQNQWRRGILGSIVGHYGAPTLDSA